MTKKEERIIKAFKNAVTSGQYEPWYATLLMMDTQRFGWISEAVKEAFYDWLDEWEASHSEPETVELPGIQQAAGDPEYGEPVEEPEEPEADDMDNVSAPTDPLAYETPETEPEEETQPDPEESADTVGDEPTAEDTPSEE
jgi:hypothetical protein